MSQVQTPAWMSAPPVDAAPAWASAPPVESHPFHFDPDTDPVTQAKRAMTAEPPQMGPPEAAQFPPDESQRIGPVAPETFLHGVGREFHRGLDQALGYSPGLGGNHGVAEHGTSAGVLPSLIGGTAGGIVGGFSPTSEQFPMSVGGLVVSPIARGIGAAAGEAAELARPFATAGKMLPAAMGGGQAAGQADWKNAPLTSAAKVVGGAALGYGIGKAGEAIGSGLGRLAPKPEAEPAVEPAPLPAERAGEVVPDRVGAAEQPAAQGPEPVPAEANVPQEPPQPVEPARGEVGGGVGRNESPVQESPPSPDVTTQEAPNETLPQVRPGQGSETPPEGQAQPQAQPEPLRGGGEPGEVTSIKNASMAADRAAFGLDELPEAQRKGFQQSLDEARAQGIPDRAMRIAEEVNAKPRTLTDAETAGLTIKAAQLKSEHAALADKIAKTEDPAEIQFHGAEMDRIQDEFDLLSRATKMAGTETGRQLAARKITIDQDYNLVSVKARAKAAKGEPLDQGEKDQFAQLTAQIDRLTKRLEDAQKGADALTPEAEKLAAQRDIVRRKVSQKIADLKPRTFWGTTMEVGSTSRNLVASTDYSAVLRQGGWIAAGHPIRAASELGPMFKAGASEAAYQRIQNQIEARPNFSNGVYQRAKLGLTNIGGKLSEQEERFMSGIADKIPLVAGSQRAYTAYLNKLRADSFDAMAETLTRRSGELTEADATAIAHYVNVATGRGTLGRYEDAGPMLNSLFFAPKLTASRFQLVLMEPLWGKRARGASLQAKGLIAQEYARSLAGIGVMYGLATLSAGAIGATLDFDPRSADFGKIRLGNTRIDPLMGLAQTTRFITKMTLGEKKTQSGMVVPISGDKVKFGGETTTDTIERFLRTKLAPIPSAILNAREGKDVVGNKVTVGSEAAGLVTPLSLRDVYESMKQHGIPEGAAIGLLSVFGMGVENHQNRTK